MTIAIAQPRRPGASPDVSAMQAPFLLPANGRTDLGVIALRVSAT